MMSSWPKRPRAAKTSGSRSPSGGATTGGSCAPSTRPLRRVNLVALSNISTPEALGPGSVLVQAVIERQTMPRWFLTAMAHDDVRLHVTEAQHMVCLLTPERPVL